MGIKNVFRDLPEVMAEEISEALLDTRHFRLERIISSGQRTPSGEWYDQESNEWVILLEGSAGLLFEGEKEACVMRPGDYVHIPAHRRHRVEWTEPEQKTVWLALHYPPHPPPSLPLERGGAKGFPSSLKGGNVRVSQGCPSPSEGGKGWGQH